MKVEIDYKFGQIVYLKNDPDQMEHLITRFILPPKGVLILELFTPTQEYIEVWEGIVTTERDKLKLMALDDDAIAE